MKIALDIESWCSIIGAQSHLEDHVFWVASLDYTQHVFVSPSFKSLWGANPEIHYANTSYFCSTLTADHRDKFIHYCIERHNESEHGTVIYQIKTEYGELKWIRDNFMTLHDQKGNPLAAAGIAIDITDKIDYIKHDKDKKVITDYHDSLQKNYSNQLKENLNILIDAKKTVLPTLTSREQQCLTCLKRGFTAKETAELLHISRRTAEKHIDSLRMKFKCATKMELLILLSQQ